MDKLCWIVVLGDFGRSPRMQYHTKSLVEVSPLSAASLSVNFACFGTYLTFSISYDHKIVF